MNIRKPLETAPQKQCLCHRVQGAVWMCLFVIGWSVQSTFAGEPYSLGSVHTWGMDWYGMTEIPEEIESKNVTAVSAGVFSMALTEDGGIYVWGDGSPLGGAVLLIPEILSGKRVVSISAGNTHALVLTDDSGVYGWGRTYATGIPVPDPPEWAQSGIRAVSAGGGHSLALTVDTGRLWFWGSLQAGYPVSEMPPGGGFKAIASGGSHCLALTEDGRVVAWGTNNLGQTDVPVELTDGSVRVKKISAGTDHNLALTEDGQIWGWGDDAYGAATEYHQFYGFKDVAAGDKFSVAITSRDTVLAWGYNEFDQAVPPEKLTDSDHPDFLPVIAISAGWNHGLALTSSPKVATPVISTEPFATQVNVTLSCATEGAAIYYTLDGSVPTIEDGTPYSGYSFAVIQPATLRARAFKDGYPPSEIAEQEMIFQGRAIVVSGVEFGSVAIGDTVSGKIKIRSRGQLTSTVVSVSIDSDDEGVFQAFFSSMVHIDPGEEIEVSASFTPDGGGLFTGEINVLTDPDTRILGSDPVATGTGFVPPPEGLKDSGTYYRQVAMELQGHPGTSLFFRIHTDEWTAWRLYDRNDEVHLIEPGAILFEAKAISGEHESVVLERNFNIFHVNATPTLDFGEVEVGTQATRTITLSSEGGINLSLERARYFLLGRDETELFGDEATWPLELASDGTVELAVTFEPDSDGGVNGWAEIGFEGASGFLNLPITGTGVLPPQVATPTFNPEAGEGPFYWSVPVELLVETEGAAIYYTLDGSEPDEGSTLYDGDPFDLADGGWTTIKARAFKDGWRASEVAAGEYRIVKITIGTIGGVRTPEDELGVSIDEEGEGHVIVISEIEGVHRVTGFLVRVVEPGKVVKVGPLISHAGLVPDGIPMFTDEDASPVAGDEPEPEIIGSIGRDGTLTFDIPGFGEFTGSVDLMTGPAAAMAGGYEIDLLYSDSGTCYAVVGSDGTVIMVIDTPDGAEGCRGVLDSSGHVVMTTSGSGVADLTIGADHSMTLMLTPQGSTEVVEFSGLADGETGMNRLINLSTRGYVGTQSENMIAGFVITGTGAKPVLIRAMGPTLADPAYGVPGVIEDPQIQVKSLDTDLVVATNDDWEDTQEMLDAILVTGAFPASGVGSKDAMVLTELDPGPYTAKISGVSAATGVAIVEVYTVEDLDTPEARQVNISTRGFVGSGGSIMILGLKADGNVPRQFLIRAVGPTLADFGISGVLTDPVLTVVRISDGAEVATNDDWDEGASGDAIHALSQQLGAFALPRGSKDAVVLVTLPTTSGFTVKVSGKNGETGVAIAEVYEVP